MVDTRLNKEKYQEMESYCSDELLELFVNWKDEYMQAENADDTVDFFYRKLNKLMEGKFDLNYESQTK